MKYFENGFFESQNVSGTRISVTDEKWQVLLNQQSLGYEIYVNENGEMDVKEPQLTLEDSLQNEYFELCQWFEEYDMQIKQFARAQRLNLEFDKDISALDNLAEQKAARLKQVKALLKI